MRSQEGGFLDVNGHPDYVRQACDASRKGIAVSDRYPVPHMSSVNRIGGIGSDRLCITNPYKLCDRPPPEDRPVSMPFK